jgi:hypothetical protein
MRRQPAARASAWKNSAKAKTVTAVEGQEGTAGAVLAFAPNLGWVPDERAAKGRSDSRRKKGEDRQPNSIFDLQGFLTSGRKCEVGQMAKARATSSKLVMRHFAAFP